MSTAEKVLTVLARVVQAPEVSQDLNLRLFESHLLDSLGTVELIVAFSQEFGVEISPAELEREQWATPGKIIEFMEARVEGGHPTVG